MCFLTNPNLVVTPDFSTLTEKRNRLIKNSRASSLNTLSPHGETREVAAVDLAPSHGEVPRVASLGLGVDLEIHKLVRPAVRAKSDLAEVARSRKCNDDVFGRAARQMIASVSVCVATADDALGVGPVEKVLQVVVNAVIVCRLV